VRTLTSLVGRQVVTTDGRRLGAVHDVRAELTSSSLRVTALVVGKRGWLEHFGIGGQAGASRAPVGDEATIPWDAVTRIEGRRIVVRDDAFTE
jgi:sporulation protein YlmC with PRC-barrel domain